MSRADPLAPRRLRVRLGDQELELAYADVPPEGGPVRGAVVYVHGFIASRRHFRPVIERLRGRGWRQVAVDLPGFGESGMLARPHRLEDYADAVAALIAALGLRPAVVGHSMGGMVAVELAHRHPHAAAALVLVAPAGLPHPHHRIPAWVRIPLLSDVLTRVVLTRPVARVYFRRTLAALDALPAQWAEDLRYGVLRCREVRRMRRFYAMPHFLSALARVAVPVGLIWGEQDRVVPAGDAEPILAALGGHAPLVRLPGVGHSPMHEDPDGFAAALHGLLEHLCREAAAGAGGADAAEGEVRPRRAADAPASGGYRHGSGA